MDETKHWETLKAGNIQSLQELYNHHISGLYAYGMVLCQDGDRVKDSIHDLFLSIWTNRQGFTIPTSGKAYLMVSLRRKIFDRGAKRDQLNVPLEESGMDQELYSDAEEQWIRSEEEAEVQLKLDQAMAQLSDRQREIIHMKYYQQMEYDDIARIMDLNYQSARNLVNRALLVLRKEMITLAMILLLMM
jgi:RNA polymerase sigma-70 factor (ECF subfamily)